MSDRIVFAGTPEFAAIILDGLVAAGHAPVAVYTQPDRHRGRSRREQPPPVKVCAQQAGLEVRQPVGFRTAGPVEALAALRPDLLIVAAYGLILPVRVLQIPAADGRRSVNVHASLLPRWRGAAPVERAIMAGDHQTGVCLMQMERRLDAGPIFAQDATPIRPDESAGELTSRLALMGLSLLLEHRQALLAGTLTAEPQSTEGVEYAAKITRQDSTPDFADGNALARQILAMRERGAVTVYAGPEPIHLLRARPVAAEPTDPPGTLRVPSRKQLLITCAQGAIAVDELRLSRGKGRAMNAAAALNGFGPLLADGTLLSAEPGR